MSLSPKTVVSVPLNKVVLDYGKAEIANCIGKLAEEGWRDLCNYVDTSAINVRAAEAVLHLEERISSADYSVIVMI